MVIKQYIPYIAVGGALLLGALLLSACGEEQPPLAQSAVEQELLEPTQPSEPEELEPPLPGESPSSSTSGAVDGVERPVLRPVPEAYFPAEGIAARDLVKEYFEVQYQAYAQLAYVDMGGVLDMGRQDNRDMDAWFRLLAQRRRLLQEAALCYVETALLPYEIVFEDEADGDKDSLPAKGEDMGEDVLVLHFRITGEKGKAYPPFMAMNTRHTMFLEQTETGWSILRHDFPGSQRMFLQAGEAPPLPDDDMLEVLEAEFRVMSEPPARELSTDAAWYAPTQAVEYAMRYTEQPDPAFDQMEEPKNGGGTSFISQCVWVGFGGWQTAIPRQGAPGMTERWYAGSPAWERPGEFWDCITTSKELHSDIFVGASQLEAGDILQTRNASALGEEGRFSHTLLVVDGDTLLLAQNNPACFTYYADLANVEVQTARPAHIKVE